MDKSNITAIAIALGSMFTVVWQTNAQLSQHREMWQREKLSDFMQRERERRLTALVNMQTALAEASRLSIVYETAGTEGQSTITRLLHCSDAGNRTASASTCQIESNSPSLVKAIEDFAVLNGRFEAAQAAVKVLFCDGTLAALAELPQGPWWWNANDVAKRRLTDAMAKDLMCGFDEIMKLPKR
jgi:hypothetical protein